MALVNGRSPGTMRLKSNMYADDMGVVDSDCSCPCCKGGFSRAKLHAMLKAGEPMAAQLLTAHNIAYMMKLTRGMRAAILRGEFEAFARDFLTRFYPGGYSEDVMNGLGVEVGGKGGKEEGEEKEEAGENAGKKKKKKKKRKGGEGEGEEEEEIQVQEEEEVAEHFPKWVVEAMRAAGIDLEVDEHEGERPAKKLKTLET